MRAQRPKNLDLTTIRLPLPGVVSILHRASGALLFLVGIPVFLDRLDRATHPDTATPLLPHGLEQPLLWLLTWAFLHHFCAGIRFLLLDVHCGTERVQARRSSVAVLLASGVLTLVLGGWLW